MGRSGRIGRIVGAAVVAGAGLAMIAPPASATYHQMKIREVHPDNQGGSSTGDYVELQMFSAGQNLVAGKHIRTFDPGGTLNTDFQLPSGVPNGQNQRTILIGNGGTVGGVTPDFNAGLSSDLDLTGHDGAVCFTEDDVLFTPVDCVSYGNFTGVLPAAGTPAAAAQFGETLERTIAPNCLTLLEDADDTNSSATDFALTTTPSPRNNSTAPTETACPQPPPAPGGGATDTTPPDTRITGGPKKKQKKGKATFSFSSSEPGSTFECKLD